MAQVTMSNQEYNALQRKADMFDTLFAQVLSNYKVVVEDSRWRSVWIDHRPEFDIDVEKHIVKSIAEQFVSNERAMNFLATEDEYIFDMRTSSITNPGWDNRLYQGQYDMRELSEEFKQAWQEAKDRTEFVPPEEEEEEEVKEEEA
jgi:hypothetical protein